MPWQNWQQMKTDEYQIERVQKLHEDFVGVITRFRGNRITILVADSINSTEFRYKTRPPKLGIGSVLYAAHPDQDYSEGGDFAPRFYFRVCSFQSVDPKTQDSLKADSLKNCHFFAWEVALGRAAGVYDLQVRYPDLQMTMIAEVIEGLDSFCPTQHLKVFLARGEILARGLFYDHHQVGARGQIVAKAVCTANSDDEIGTDILFGDSEACKHTVIFSSDNSQSMGVSRAIVESAPEEAIKILITDKADLWESLIPAPSENKGKWLEVAHFLSIAERGFGLSAATASEVLSLLGDQTPRVMRTVQWFLDDVVGESSKNASLLTCIRQTDTATRFGDDATVGEAFYKWAKDKTDISGTEVEHICSLFFALEKQNLLAESRKRHGWLALDLTTTTELHSRNLVYRLLNSLSRNLTSKSSIEESVSITWILERADQFFPNLSGEDSSLGHKVRTDFYDFMSAAESGKGLTFRFVASSKHPSYCDPMMLRFFKHRFIGPLFSESDRRWVERHFFINVAEYAAVMASGKRNHMLLDSPILRPSLVLCKSPQ